MSESHGSRSASAGQPVSVSRWGDLPAEWKMSCASCASWSPVSTRAQSSTWAAPGPRTGSAGMTASGSMRDRVTEYASADEALRAVVRSAWLGAWAPARRPGCTGLTAPAGPLAAIALAALRDEVTAAHRRPDEALRPQHGERSLGSTDSHLVPLGERFC